MKIVRLEESDGEIFKTICKWNYDWWGIRNNNSIEEVESYFKHSLCKKDRLPQTFIGIIDNKVVGMYQIAMTDDLISRPDIYPWLINVYVDKKYRGQGICRELMYTVKENAKKIGLSELYLYTEYKGLYEKFSWEFIEEIKTFKEDAPIQRLYKLNIN